MDNDNMFNGRLYCGGQYKPVVEFYGQHFVLTEELVTELCSHATGEPVIVIANNDPNLIGRYSLDILINQELMNRIAKFCPDVLLIPLEKTSESPKEKYIRAQLCRFNRTKDSEYEDGIAILDIFDLYSVDNIIDTNGNIVQELWDYKLISGPLAYLDSSITRKCA